MQNKANLFVLRSADCVKMRNRNLKKQSQFAKGENDVKQVMTGFYEDLAGWMRRKNKANSKPIAGHWPEIRSSPAFAGVNLSP